MSPASLCFLLALAFAARIRQDVRDKLESCNAACDAVTAGCSAEETCYCGTCSSEDLESFCGCGAGETCIGDSCYSSIVEAPMLQGNSNGLLGDDYDCGCEDGQVCYWGMCFSSNSVCDENCVSCFMNTYCLDQSDEDTDESSCPACSSNCASGYECNCGVCQQTSDSGSNSSAQDTEAPKWTQNTSNVIFGLTLIGGILFFLIFGIFMYRKYLLSDTRNSDTGDWNESYHDRASIRSSRSNRGYKKHRNENLTQSSITANSGHRGAHTRGGLPPTREDEAHEYTMDPNYHPSERGAAGGGGENHPAHLKSLMVRTDYSSDAPSQTTASAYSSTSYSSSSSTDGSSENSSVPSSYHRARPGQPNYPQRGAKGFISPAHAHSHHHPPSTSHRGVGPGTGSADSHYRPGNSYSSTPGQRARSAHPPNTRVGGLTGVGHVGAASGPGSSLLGPSPAAAAGGGGSSSRASGSAGQNHTPGYTPGYGAVART